MKPHHSTFHMSLAALALLFSAGEARSQWLDVAAAAQYSESRNGEALLVYSRGRLVAERYSGGYLKTTPHRLASGTKSFSGVLAAMAVRDGLLTSLDEKVAETITEWKTSAVRARITYRQLLSLSSGIDGGTNGQVPSYADSIRAAVTGTPGRSFSYGPNPFQIFGEALKRKLASSRRTVTQYLEESILKPLGMTYGSWRNAATGEPNLPSGAFFIATEWAKFGDFLRLGGVVGGKRILDESLLDECTKLASANPNYRLTFWGPGPGDAGPGDIIWAAGAGKQRLYVSRELDLVVLRFGETAGLWGDSNFLDALLPAAAIKLADGCRGSAGVATLGAVSGKRPVLGTRDYAIEIASAPASAFGVILLGASRRNWLGIPLPIDFTSASMPGCFLHVSPDIILGFRCGADGKFRFEIPIGSNRALSGKFVFFQAMLQDAAANGAGFTFSDALVHRNGTR